jgi:hypothetical protein
VAGVSRELDSLRSELDVSRMLSGRLLAEQIALKGPVQDLRETEFKVFSQFGDDGIIQYLVRTLGVEPHRFIEFGVGDYRESNTRYLLMNNNWKGLILDGNGAAMERIKRDPICQFHDLTAAREFITRENINDLFQRYRFTGEIGLLSVDIDGNDYWVWEAIQVIDPVMVVCEYNSVFGPRRAVTVPYDGGFVRQKAHYTHLYYGASLAALCALGKTKGYAFVGSNSNGNNAYFVKTESLKTLRSLSPEAGWVESRFRESHDRNGNLTYLSGSDRLDAIADCLVVDVETGRTVTCQSLH